MRMDHGMYRNIYFSVCFFVFARIIRMCVRGGGAFLSSFINLIDAILIQFAFKLAQ